MLLMKTAVCVFDLLGPGLFEVLVQSFNSGSIIETVGVCQNLCCALSGSIFVKHNIVFFNPGAEVDSGCHNPSLQFLFGNVPVTQLG